MTSHENARKLNSASLDFLVAVEIISRPAIAKSAVCTINKIQVAIKHPAVILFFPLRFPSRYPILMASGVNQVNVQRNSSTVNNYCSINSTPSFLIRGSFKSRSTSDVTPYRRRGHFNQRYASFRMLFSCCSVILWFSRRLKWSHTVACLLLMSFSVVY